MLDKPSHPEKDPTNHSQPTGLGYVQPFVTSPVQGSNNQAVGESRVEDNFKTSGLKALLPNALAKEERSTRLRLSRARRRRGVVLDAEEIRGDLYKIMTHLNTHLGMHLAGVNVIFKLPAQALLYAERKALYAITDYPRVFENNSTIMTLWDALERIYTTASEWRKDEQRGDGKAVIVSIERMVKAAMRAASSPPDGDTMTSIDEA